MIFPNICGFTDVYFLENRIHNKSLCNEKYFKPRQRLIYIGTTS